MSITIGDAVVYLISDDSQLKAGLANAQGLTDGFAQTMGGSFKSAIGTMMSEAMGLVTSAVQEGVTQFGSFFMGGIEGAINLDQQMANIASTIGKTKAEVAPLKEEIMRLALDPELVVNTKQAAEAIELLAKNGLEMDQIMGGASKSVVALANATGNDFKLAAATMSDAMKQFGIDAADSSKIIDGMVGVTTNGKFKLLDYSYALAQAGGVAAQVGIPFDEFSTTIAAVSDTFKKGQSAGTALRGMIQSMSNPTDEARAAMEQYGVSLFDAQGKTKPMSQVVQELHDVFSKDVTITNSVTTATDAMGNTIVLTAEKQKELQKAQEEASAKMPDLGYKIQQQERDLQFLQNTLFETSKWYDVNSDKVLKAKAAVDDKTRALEKSRAEMANYQLALQGVSNANTETTTTTRALSDEEKARLTKLFGGTVAGAQLVADISKMTAEQFNALNEEINKTGSGLQAAATRVDSVQGAFEVLSSVTEAIQIQMADGFLPAIRSVTVAITELASQAGPYMTAFFADLGAQISSQVDSWLALGRNIAILLSPLQTAGGGLGEASAQLSETKKAIDGVMGAGFADWLLRMRDSVTGMVAVFNQGGLTGVLQQLFNQLSSAVPSMIENLGQALLSGASSLLGYTTQLLQSIPQALASFAPDAESAQQLGASLAQSILSAFGLAVSSGEAVSSPLGEFFKALGTAAMSMSGVLFEVATNIASGFLIALQERFTTIDMSTLFGSLAMALGGGGLVAAFSGLGAAALSMVSPFMAIGAAISAGILLWANYSDEITKVGGMVATWLTPTWEKLQVAFAAFIDNLAPAIPSIKQLFDTFVAAIPSMQLVAGVIFGGLIIAIGRLGDMMAAVMPAIGTIITGITVTLTGAISGAVQFIDGAIQMITGLLTGNLKQASDGALDVITGLAEGIVRILAGNLLIAEGLITGLAAGISEAIPQLGDSLNNLAAYIIDTVKDLLGVASPSTIFAEIGLNLIEGLIEGIGEAADSAYSIMEEVVTTLIDTTLEIIESGASGLAEAWSAAWDVVAESTSQAIDGVIEYVGGLADGAIELIGSAMDAIGELWDSGWSMIADLADGVIGTITDIIDSFTSDGEGMMDGFMSAVSDLWDAGWSTIYDLADSVIGEIYSTLDGFSSDANSTWDSLTANLSEIWDSAWATMTEALASATETIGGYIDGAASTASSIWDALGNDLSALWGAAWGYIADTMSSATGAISGLMGGAQATLSASWQILSDYLNTAWATAWTVITTVGESAWLAIGSGVDTLSSGLQTAWETMSGVVSTMWETAWSTIGATYERVSAAIKSGIETLRDGVTTAMSATTETISTMWNTVWEVAGRATTAGKTNIISLVSDFLIGARQKFDDFRDKWVDAGKMMMSGVMDGLELMRDDFIDMFEELAWAALRRVKEVLGMQSPSTVFRDEVGVQMVAGMTEGMEQESGSMFDTIGNIAGGAVDAAVKGISGARDAIGGIFGGAFGEYISNNMKGQIQQATETAAINMEGVIAGLRQSADLNYIANTNKKASWDNVKNAVRSETADAIKLLNDQYQQMLTAGMNPEEALAKYNEAAKQAQAIIETAALKNSNIAHGGQNGGVSGIFGEIGTEINKAIEAAKVMKDNQLGLSDVFDFSLGSVEEELKVNLDSILNAAKSTVDNLSATYKDWDKSNGSVDKVLKDMADAAIKGITDGSKEMVNQTKALLAAGMSPQEAMKQYVDMTNQAYQVLGNDTLIKKLPDTVREGKQVLSEAYKDILDTLDSQFIGGTNAKLKQAGNLFKQGLADGIDASTLISVFNDQMSEIKKTTEDTFIQGMPGTLSKANDLLDTQYRTMKNDLEKGLISNMKESTKKAGETLTQGLKSGLDPAQLIAEYKATLDDLQATLNNTDLLTLVPEAVNTAYNSVNETSDKLLGSIQKDFVGGVKSGLGTAESELKKGFANMTDPAQAQGFINAYLASVKDIKETFKGGVASMIPDALTEASGLATTSAEKMAGDISKNFIKASKDKFKDMALELKQGLESGADPVNLLGDFMAMSDKIGKELAGVKSSIANGLGQVIPKDLMAMDAGEELAKAREQVEKFLTTDIKEKMTKAAADMKEGVKKGLNLEELVSAYKNTAETLKNDTNNVVFGGATMPAIEAQLKATKDYIENEFGKQVKDDIKGITTGLKNSLTLGDSPAKALADYQRELAKVNGFIGSELGRSMPEAMKAARESVTENYEDVFGAIAKQAKGSLSEAKTAFKEALASGVDPSKAMADYQAVASGITQVIGSELGKNAPLAVKAAKDELEDSLKAVKELLKKNLVTDVKDQMSDASKAFKEGLKEGLDPQGLLTAYQAATDAASATAKGLGDFPLVMDETNAKIKATTEDMLALLKNNLVAGVKERMGSLKTDLKENMDFGGTVAEALADLNSKSQALKDEFANGLGKDVPGAIEAANALIEEQKTALLKNLGGKFVGELKDAIKEQATAYKEALEQGIDPAQALGAFNASISSVMAGMTTQLTEATPNLARMANGLVAAAQAELAKLGGGDIGNQATAAIGDGINSTVAALAGGVQGAVTTLAASVAPVVTTIAGAMSEALPEVTIQGDLLIAEVNRIGGVLITTVTGEGGIFPTLTTSVIGALTGELGLLPQIKLIITNEAVAIKPIATAYGLSIGAGIAEGIANGSQAIYDNLSLITTRVNTDMVAINSQLAQAQASQAALAAVGQAAQQMVANINNANNAVTTTNNNNIVINNPVPQPAAMDLMMIRNMSDR